MFHTRSKRVVVGWFVCALLVTLYAPVAGAAGLESSGGLETRVQQAMAMQTDAGQPLLPANTRLDRLEWHGNVVHVYLTVEATDPAWRLSSLDMERLSRTFQAPYANDPAYGGVKLRVRQVGEASYGSLERFGIDRSRPAPSAGSEPAERPRPFDHAGDAPVKAVTSGIGGPTVQASRQPTGALSGVVVYASAGHGWTAAPDGDWYLQRPVLWEMAEDYGNIDQLNYFVHYAFNAGATVVPFRPVGWQSIEIVLDQDDPGVTFEGTWSGGSSSKYYENGVTMSGEPYKWSSASTTETATARYTPTITVTDFYPVYCFAIAGQNRTRQTYRVAHSGGINEITIDHRETGNGWIWLGNYYLEAGGDNYVEITNESPEEGAIIADAIRWGGGEGDIVRPGPGVISGYPRDEEAQRYWAQSELGNNGVGFDSWIWDIEDADDGSDNVRTGAKWAAEMNVVPLDGLGDPDVTIDRWKRIHLEFHTNAFAGSARGQICLITSLGETLYQQEYATTLSDEFDLDMGILDTDFEHEWFDRASPTLTGEYGAICTPANGDEFDATIIEIAFHDNERDAQLLRDPRFRSVAARACVHGIIKFLNSLPDSQVPLAFAPDTPRNVAVADAGGGDIVLTWAPPLSDEARGDPATGYVIYQSTNGYGFGDPIVLGDVQTHTISDIPVGEIRYFRIAATNAGGESMPSAVLAVRRPTEGNARIMIVNDFDQMRRQQDPRQILTQPAAYAGDEMDRPKWRDNNAYDYVIQYAEALAAIDRSFASCDSRAVVDDDVALSDYDIAIWVSGEQGTKLNWDSDVADPTITPAEQTRINAYLDQGGNLFLSGAELAWYLDNQEEGRSFYEISLRANYVANDAGTYEVTGVPGGIFAPIASFDFDPANGARYNVESPDQISARPDGFESLSYVGGTGGGAAVEFDNNGIYRVVTFGFPFETISSADDRAAVLERVILYLEYQIGPLDCDNDHDGDVDLDDYVEMDFCFVGPEYSFPPGHFCTDFDFNDDLRIDLADLSVCQKNFGRP